MANFQERLKQLRTEAGLTQNELAEKLQMSKGAIGNYESGQREPNMDTLDTIADFFNVELDYLRGRTNTRPELSLEEQWLVDCYRKTDDEIRTAVKSILRHFSEKPVEIKKPVRIIPLFPAAAAKGVGRLENAAWVQIPSSAPSTQKSHISVVFGYFFAYKAAPRRIPQFREKT